MNASLEVLTEVRGEVGFITLNRPKALNALSLGMIRALSSCLIAWRTDPAIKAVAVRGTNKMGVFGAFCAGGDIRFFHQAALAGDASLEDFFTEEYALNHLIHRYHKPYITFLDGIVMGGGMGLCGHDPAQAVNSSGAKLRIVTERSKLAMPETLIGLFPDVGGGYFLSRCPGRIGEWLALTGEALDAGQALGCGLADKYVAADQLDLAWDALANIRMDQADALEHWLEPFSSKTPPFNASEREQIDRFFALMSVKDIVLALEADASDWAQRTAAMLRKRSPLMLQVTLSQIRRGRTLSLADDLRMERDMVQHCFDTRHLARSPIHSETVEGIRALAVDKDNTPHWNPVRIEDVTEAMVAPFFTSPWTPQTHPLRNLRD